MLSPSTLAGLVISVATLPTQPWAGSPCPAASGDGETDDTRALQCLLEEGDANEAIQLKKGATYLITRTLHPSKRRIVGGAGSQGLVTTILCHRNSFLSFIAFEVNGREDFHVYGIRVDHCRKGFSTSGNLTLVDSTISNTADGAVDVRFASAGNLTFVDCTINNTYSAAAVRVRGGGGKGSLGSVFMRRSRILRTRGHGISALGKVRLVLEKSEIMHATGNGVALSQASTGVALELHSSSVRDCTGSAILVTLSQGASVLVASQSSVEGSRGPCISLLGGFRHRVNIVGGSRIQGCESGVLLHGASLSDVVLKGSSSICGSQHGLLLESGTFNRVAIQDGSRIRQSFFNAIKVTERVGLGLGTSKRHKVEVSGRSAIEDSGGTGILVEAGSGHAVNITGGSWLRKSGRHGVRLAATGSRLRLNGAAIRESGGSAVSATLSAVSSAAWASPAHECTFAVSLQSAYLVRNGGGFHCESACAEGEISGAIYLNGMDFDNHCSGELPRWGPLLGIAEFPVLKAHVWWCSLGVAAGVSFLPWWRACSRAHDSPGSRLAPAVVLAAVVALLVPTTHAWVSSMLDLWRVTRVLKREDLAKEGVGLLFALACCVALCVPPASLAASQRWYKQWREVKVLELLRSLEASLWQGHSEEVQLLCALLVKRGLAPAEIQGKVRELRRQQSLEAGVSVAYLLSPDFLELARTLTGLENPTFLQMKDPFWSGENAIGKGVLCPRDGRPGCALVDTLHPRYRQRCTHFLSWVWRYPILLVREALEIWTQEEGLDPSRTFLFMCFFVNNQFRILVEGVQTGSDDLETTFEQNLQRIGRLVALLDHWKQPLYLSRIWTIYEQYVAAKLQLPVTVILNRSAGESLIDELDKGRDGIFHITGTFCKVRAETAEASVKSDEEHVKAIIRNTTGFDYVNQRVTQSMSHWVASVIRLHMDILINSARAGVTTDRHQLARQASCTRLEGGTSIAALEVQASP